MLDDNFPLPTLFLMLAGLCMTGYLCVLLLKVDESDQIAEQQIEMVQKNADFKVEGNSNILEDLERLKTTKVTESKSKESLERAIDAKSAEIAAVNLKANSKTAKAVEDISKKDSLKALDEEYAKKRAAIEAEK